LTADEAAGAGGADARAEALRGFVARVAPAVGQDIRAELDDAAAEVLDAFNDARLDALLLKGRALASILYRPEEERLYSDVDLLVGPHQLAAAEQSLTALGFINADAVYGIDDVGGVVHAQTWMRTARGSTESVMIDLHRWLPGCAAPPDVAWAALWERRVSIEVGGRKTSVLDRVGQALQLATHCAQHGSAVGKPQDELELGLERWPEEVWESAAVLASQVGATEAFAAGLRLRPRGEALASRLGLMETPELDWRLRNRQNRPRGTFHLHQALADLRSPRELLGIARRSLFPSRAWIVHEYPWVGQSMLRLVGAYGLHLARSPLWATRAWLYLRRAHRAARRGV
jgi:hypothetical protein